MGWGDAGGETRDSVLKQEYCLSLAPCLRLRPPPKAEPETETRVQQVLGEGPRRGHKWAAAAGGAPGAGLAGASWEAGQKTPRTVPPGAFLHDSSVLPTVGGSLWQGGPSPAETEGRDLVWEALGMVIQ